MSEKIEWGAGTPGPWDVRDVRYNRDFRTCLNVQTDDGLRFVAAVSCDPHTDHEHLTANARAIAEVPAMVAMLREVAEGHALHIDVLDLLARIDGAA